LLLLWLLLASLFNVLLSGQASIFDVAAFIN